MDLVCNWTEVLREQAIEKLRDGCIDKATAEFKAAFDKFMETKENTKANTEATKHYSLSRKSCSSWMSRC